MAKDKITDAERELFRSAVAGARPLAHDKIKPPRQAPPPIPQQRRRDEQAIMQSLLSDPVDTAELMCGDELAFARNGVASSLQRKLRRGELRIEAELDLHRMTRDAARTAIAEFLHACLHQHKRCVRIIHGKGHGSFNKQPVLKGLVNHWLQQRNEVLAFCSARPNDGGAGAVYVLLRRSS